MRVPLPAARTTAVIEEEGDIAESLQPLGQLEDRARVAPALREDEGQVRGPELPRRELLHRGRLDDLACRARASGGELGRVRALEEERTLLGGEERRKECVDHQAR